MGHFNSTEKSAAATAGTKVRALPCACTQPGRAYHEGMDRPTLEALQRLMDVLRPLHHLTGCEPFSSHHVNTCTMPAEAGPRFEPTEARGRFAGIGSALCCTVEQ